MPISSFDSLADVFAMLVASPLGATGAGTLALNEPVDAHVTAYKHVQGSQEALLRGYLSLTAAVLWLQV